MSEMVERVTEAINQAERDWLESDRAISLQEATAWAAIRAMRKPTAQMLDAGGAVENSNRIAKEVWEAMIDEALK